MGISLKDAANMVLAVLAEIPREQSLRGNEIAEKTGLSPEDINDAVTLLVESGNAEWLRTLGTAPYNFRSVELTARGRYEFERAVESQAEAGRSYDTLRPPSPIGSPYGFQDEDWEVVAARKESSSTLFVVLGYQFRSDNYDAGLLKKNVELMFQFAVDAYNKLAGTIPVTLDFRPLNAGYGEHLFNEIARDVIGADIATFDTSDLNPNVMLEMGMALTWGVRVLPIKAEGCPKPPSDISGQTWADYRDSAAQFVDPEHNAKLLRMVQRAARKKP